MERSPVPARVYRFGPFELSREAGELRKSGIHLKLQDQPFQVLCTLLDHPGEVVTREQLRQQLWPEGTFVDFEHGLNTAIKKLRDVLSDDADTPRYIETIPRKGYRFIAPLDGTTSAGAHTDGKPQLPSRRLLISLALTACISAIAIFTIYSFKSPRTLRITATRQLTFDGNVAPFSPIKTDGRRVFYSVSILGDHRIYSISSAGGASTTFDTPINSPVITDLSSDGAELLLKDVEWRGATEEARFWRVSTSGGLARRVGDLRAEKVAWAPGGKGLVVAKGNSLLATEDDGSSYQKLLDTALPISDFAWSPDGKRLLLSLLDGKTGTGSLWEAKSNSAVQRLPFVISANESLCCPEWTRDGRYFLFGTRQDERSDLWSVTSSSFPWHHAVPSLVNAGGLQVAGFTTSPLENTIFMVGFQESGVAYFYEPESHTVQRVFPGFSIYDVHFSRDGQQMLFVQPHTSSRVLWRARSNGSELQQLTDSKLFVYRAALSPDGKRVAVMGKWPSKPWKIYWMSAEGGVLHEVTNDFGNYADPSWSPDSQSIFFGQPPPYWAEPGSTRAIYRANLASGALTKIPSSEGWFDPRVSPDGRLVACLSIDEHHLAVSEVGTGKWRILVEDESNTLGRHGWSPDGAWLYFIVFVHGNQMLNRINIRSGERREVVSLPDLTKEKMCTRYDFTPDRKLVISCFRIEANIYALQYQ